MNINEITVINFGSVRFFQVVLGTPIAIVETKYISELSAAIEMVLCKKTVSSLSNRWLRDDTEIKAEVCVDDFIYYVLVKANRSDFQTFSLCATDAAGRELTKEYLSLLSHCTEQDVVENFNGFDKTVPIRLCWYRNVDDYEPSGCLHAYSAHIATTKTFRGWLAKYISEFEPEPINSRKPYYVSVRKNGKFEVIYPGLNADECLSRSEEKLFYYTCFLNIAEFWSDIESIRDLHHINKPLLIKNFLEYLDDSVAFENLKKRTLMLKRQMIFLAMPRNVSQRRKEQSSC